MLHLPFLLIIKIVAALMATGAVVVTIAYLNKREAIRIATETAAKMKGVTQAIVQDIKSGNVNVVDIGLFNANSSKVGTIKIETPDLATDISRGDVLFYA